MLANFASGGAAICVLAREAEARLVVVDAGVIDGDRSPAFDPSRRRSPGYGGPLGRPGDASHNRGGRDRTRARARRRARRRRGRDRRSRGDGDRKHHRRERAHLGDPRRRSGAVCGRGTGLDDGGLDRKLEAVRRGLAANGLPRDDADPIDVLAAVGGLRARLPRRSVPGCLPPSARDVLDGFITSAAAMVAARLARQPPVR